MVIVRIIVTAKIIDVNFLNMNFPPFGNFINNHFILLTTLYNYPIKMYLSKKVFYLSIAVCDFLYVRIDKKLIAYDKYNRAK